MQTDNKEDKKKKIKAILAKLLVFVVLVAISIATSKFNLSKMLHDFVLRIFSVSELDYDGEHVVEASALLPLGEFTLEENTLKASVNEMISDVNGNLTKEEKITKVKDNTSLLSNVDDNTKKEFLCWLEDYKNLRASVHLEKITNEEISLKFTNLNKTLCENEAQRSIVLNEQFVYMGIVPKKADCFYEIEKISVYENVTYINLYEWIFVEYEMNKKTDIMGYGIEHTLIMSDNNILDYYEDDFSDGNLLKTKSFSYDVNKAVEYADKYALKYNPNYSDYNSIGGDCANFVSQCLYAGGLQMTEDWFWKSYDNRSGSWAYCPSQVEYFTKAGWKLIENPTDGQVVKGNPVYYYSSSKDRYSHAAICVGVNDAGVPVVNAHNAERYRVPWKLGSKWAMRSTILITELPEDVKPPVVSNVKISDITNQGFKVTMKVSDNIAVSRVSIPVWTVKDGQDDLVWHTAKIENNEAVCYIKVSEHGYEGGQYIVNIYAYDEAQNSVCVDGGIINIDRSNQESFQKGDATLDGKINLEDARYVLKLALGIYKTDNIYTADYNDDKKADLTDAKIILRKALGIA